MCFSIISDWSDCESSPPSLNRSLLSRSNGVLMNTINAEEEFERCQRRQVCKARSGSGQGLGLGQGAEDKLGYKMFGLLNSGNSCYL